MAALKSATAIISTTRSIITRSRPSLSTSSFISTTTLTSKRILSASRALSPASRLLSLKPLHSAIASARLTSSLAVDCTYWSALSQDFAVPR